MKKIIEKLGKTFIDKNIGRVAGFDYLWDKKKFISGAGYHHLGGTRMGLDLKESVVDKNLKVHNVKNLFVAGSSVFPTGGAANPTLSIVQLSLKLSKFLIEKII
jgi:choline dehydrogenase-like flavoprotein